MCFTLQRYKIESNSQRQPRKQHRHNVVFYTAKIQNWKQFTTLESGFLRIFRLCFTLQRYKIESNSQPLYVTCLPNASCVLHCKDTKLKAIHNKTLGWYCLSTVVFYTAKIQNWKQFTTTFVKHLGNISCVLHCKDTKLKAIHNATGGWATLTTVVFYTAKIQNWKQFTTTLFVPHMFNMLCFTLQRYKIESNSQLLKRNKENTESCVLHCKDTKLKAIHNY